MHEVQTNLWSLLFPFSASVQMETKKAKEAQIAIWLCCIFFKGETFEGSIFQQRFGYNTSLQPKKSS